MAAKEVGSGGGDWRAGVGVKPNRVLSPLARVCTAPCSCPSLCRSDPTCYLDLLESSSAATNPLTQVKQTQVINQKEALLGINEDTSWHAKFKDSTYVFIGGISFDLTEGDLLAVFAQEVVDVNLVRDKGTGKYKGFAFLAYEDQRSTILAVDNLNGAKILGRIIRVDHVSMYKKKEEEDEKE